MVTRGRHHKSTHRPTTKTPTPATNAIGAFSPRTSSANGIHGTTETNSRYAAPGVPPTNRYKFFFHPSHIAANDRYIRTLTTPAPGPNQIRYPAFFARFASATSSITYPATLS